MKAGWGAGKLCLWGRISSSAERKELRAGGRQGGDLELVVRNLPPVHHREGRRGSIQVDGEELVSGQSPGPNVAVNTKGSIYIGKSGLGEA